MSKGADPNRFQMKMNKMVDGKEETMVTVNCKAGSDSGPYVCRRNELAK
jgi:hypothetical protein